MSGKTPGPFVQDGDMICDERRSDRQWIAMFDDADTIDDATCEEIIDLLNKGTHFDRLLAALKNVRGDAAMSDQKIGAGTFDQVRDAIAEAQGRTEG